MNKKALNTEVNKIAEEADILYHRSKLQMETTNFLRKEADKLMNERKSVDIPVERAGDLDKQIGALHIRILKELRILEDDMSRMSKLDDRINYYRNLVETNQVKD